MRFARPLLLCLCAICALRADAEELSPKELAAARKLYQSKCARCHKFYDPTGYDDAEWRTWMEKMRRKSKLKPDQFELLSRYTETLRKDPQPRGRARDNER